MSMLVLSVLFRHFLLTYCEYFNQSLLLLPDYLANIMALFPDKEYADILYCYGYCHGDATAARRAYLDWFPDSCEPDLSVLSRLSISVNPTDGDSSETNK